MKRKLLAAAAILSLTMINVSSAGQTFDEIEAELIQYIGENSVIKPTRDMPRYAFFTKERINRIFYKEHYKGQEDILAFHMDGLIVLPVDFILSENKEILLHELFHFYVRATGQKHLYRCPNEEEFAAYTLHGKFVDEKLGGVGFKLDPVSLLMLHCNYELY